MKFFTSTIVAVGEREMGAIPVTLVDGRGDELSRGRAAARRVGTGVARAGSLSVYMCNNGGGSTRTNEANGLAAMAIADHLAQCEAAGARPPALLTLADRAELRHDLGYPAASVVASG